MSKLCRSLTGTSFAVMLTLGSAAIASGQETPVPVPVPDQEPQAEAQAEMLPQAQEAQEPVIVQLSAVGGAEGSGEATLSAAAGDQSGAVIEVEGLDPGVQYSAFLVAGTCDSPGDVVAPLGTVEVADQGSGRGEVSLTSPLGVLTGSEATIQVHPQGDAPTQALLCGAVPAAGAAASLPAF